MTNSEIMKIHSERKGGHMKKTGITLFFVGIVLLGFLGKPATSTAGVDIRIGFPLPFPTVALPPPPRIVVPDADVFYAPNVDVNVFFRDGYWYRPHEGRWYRSRGHNGPWHYIKQKRMPREVVTGYPGRECREDRHHRGSYERHDRQWRQWGRNGH